MASSDNINLRQVLASEAKAIAQDHLIYRSNLDMNSLHSLRLGVRLEPLYP